MLIFLPFPRVGSSFCVSGKRPGRVHAQVAGGRRRALSRLRCGLEAPEDVFVRERQLRDSDGRSTLPPGPRQLVHARRTADLPGRRLHAGPM